MKRPTKTVKNNLVRPAVIQPNDTSSYRRTRHGARLQLPIFDGCVFVVSDQHYCSQSGPSKAHLASLVLAKQLKPWAIVANGDALDLAVVSRWPVASFTELRTRATVASELQEAADRLADYEKFKFVRYRTWNLGNHDARYETYLAEHVPQYEGINGFTLKDHFKHWLPAWRTEFMADSKPEVIVQHRFKGGMHAGQNNVLWSGTNYVTGHDHMLKAYALTNTRGLLWGIHAGTMAPIDSQLFTHYTEDRPVNWQEGFSILWFRDGRFIGPELVYVRPDDQKVLFRGNFLSV